MLTVAVELSRALVAQKSTDEIVLLCSRERPDSLRGLDCEAVVSPYRHELVLKSRWLPVVETQLDCDAILYPYWPSPPVRRAGAPPAVIFVHDLAFRVRSAEVPWQQRLYFRAVLPPALRNAAAVLVPSESTRRDVMLCVLGMTAMGAPEVGVPALAGASRAGRLSRAVSVRRLNV